MNNPNSFKKLVALLITGLLFVTAVYFIYAYITSFQSLTIKTEGNSQNTIVKLYGHGSDEQRAAVEKVTIGEPIKLKKGDYTIEFSGSGYELTSVNVTLGETAETVTIAPRYTAEKLRRILDKEKSEIHNQIMQQIPETRDKYVIESGKLYMQGQWYGAKIHKKQTPEEERLNYTDTFRIILKKENQKWTLITKPPELVLSKVKYPGIPREVLVDVNKNPE